MTEEEMTATLPSDVTDFLGMGQRRTGGYDTLVRQPSFAGGTDEFNDQTRKERKARFKASADILFSTDVSKLDDAGASALYQSVTEGLFGLPDEDGSVAFGKRASKDPRANIEMLRKFVKGDYTLIEDPEYTKWRQMDDEAKFKYALENETSRNTIKSFFKGERGPSALEVITHALTPAPMKFGALRTEAERETQRKMRYEDLTDEEKENYRADVVADYDEKLSRRQTLATFLQFAHGLSDRAGYLLAKSFGDGTPDAVNIEGLPEDERDRVYAAFSLMRGDQKKGRIFGIQTDFTDDTVANRLQLGLYGFQQSVIGLVTDTGEMARDVALWTYAKTAMDEAERKAFFKGWDANVRAEQAMKQSLPEASGIVGEAFQGLAENMHWFIPYGAIRKGGSLAKGARAVVARAGLEKEVAEGGLTLAKAAAEASRARWLADVEGAVKAGKGAKKISEFSSAIAMRRQLAAVEQYTAALREIPNVVKAAKWKDAAGAGMWAAGEASAFSAFASEYIANADAAGISREESVLTAAAIGLINAKIEQLYVPGLESSLSPVQIKSLTFAAMAQAIKTDGAAGFRKWLANRVSKGVTEGVKVAATEGLVEEPLQQIAVEHGKAFDKLCGELRANGQATLANEAKALWDSFARTLPNDYATFIDTAADMVASSLGFGVTTIGNMTRRQHIHNAMTRHANRRAGSTSTMMTAQTMQDLQGATDYDAGLVDVIQQAVNVRAAVEKHWQGEEDGGEAKNPHRFEEAITAARRAWRDPQTGDAVQEIADAAGVDVKTAEVLAQYLQTEAEAAAFSPQARAWTSLNMSLADIDEATIKTVLPGYVEGSFASDPENGIYSGRVRMDDGTEKTIAYRVGDLSAELMDEAQNMAKADSSFGKSFDARHAELGDGVTWASLSDAQRYAEAVRSQASVNGFSTGKSGVFELTDSKGEKVRVNADDIIYLANGRIGDIGYGPAATQGTVRHETFHSLWRFVRGTLADADVQQLAKTLGIDVTKDGWEVTLDERMAHEMERYASGHYVSHAVSSRFDKMLDSWAGKIIDFFGKFGPSDEVTDPKTGKPYQLKGLYDSILRGELGSGAMGVELRKVPQQTAERTAAPASSMPVEVTDADRAEAEAVEREESAKEEPPVPAVPTGPAPAVTTSTVPVATSESPADAAMPNQVYYRVGLPNSNVKLVGRLDVRDVETGVITSTDADYHDRGNQNRDDKSEESRALVEKIGANPDPLQIGTVQPIANNGIVWMLPNGDVIIGNHRVNGVRLGYAKGTTAELEKFVREDAAKRGIEIGADVKKPLMVFVLERIESPDGKADVHEVVRLANESQNRGFNIREQAGNDAKILTDNNLLPRMEFRADGRIDETKSGDAIGKFRRESGAQGLIAEDGSLTEEGQTRIQNAALAVLLGGEGNNALLNKIMTNAGRLDMQSELRALMKMTPELMALAETKPDYDLRAPIADALQLFTEWRDKDETARVEKGKTRHDWRETTKDGTRKRGLSWEAYLSQGDMFRKPSDEAKILGDLFAEAERLRSFDKEDMESAAGKKRVIDLISNYLADYIANARAINTETDDMFGGSPASRADVLAAQRAKGGEGGARFSLVSAARYNDELYNKALEMEKRGESREKIFDETGGMWKDKNGHWLIELPELTLNQIKELKDKAMQKIEESDKDYIGITYGDILDYVFPEAKSKLGKLVEVYPRLASLPIFFFKGDKTRGDYTGITAINPSDNYKNNGLKKGQAVWIEVALKRDKLHQIRTSIIHELQHFIQGEEGWPSGTSYKANAFTADDKITREIEYALNRGEINANVAGLRSKPASTKIKFAGKKIYPWETEQYIRDKIAQKIWRLRNNNIRFSIGGLYTGSAADYENPSLHYVGTGEGSQVYGWGLYASNQRGVAEGYARRGIVETTINGKKIDIDRIDLRETPEGVIADCARSLVVNGSEASRSALISEVGGSYEEYARRAEDTTKWNHKNLVSLAERYKAALEILEDKANVIDVKSLGNLYEQTFFTDRAPGDESHLLKWYEPISDEQAEWILDALKDMGSNESLLGFVNGERKKDIERDGLTWRDVEGDDAAPDYYPEDVLRDYLEQYLDLAATGGEMYGQLSEALGSPKAASEFLARAGIDGVKYPVDSYGKTVKDGDDVGWNYVSFRDDNIRVDHKWTDGEQRFSVNPGWMKAPNGKPTNLTERQWIQVRTPSFKNFFGDWQNDPENASKIVDGDGNPLVVYRGAQFDPLAQEPGKGVIKPEAYFTADPQYAKRYAGSEGTVRAYYLNIRHPFDIRDPECQKDFEKIYPGQNLARGKSGALDWAEAAIIDDEFLKENFGDKYDGIIFDEASDWAEQGNLPKWRGLSYVPLDGGAQVKSATDNNGDFSENPDIRYSVSKELTDAMRKREAMQSIPIEGKVQPWPENFPKVMLQTTLANIRQKWPELHAAAKAGSNEAALKLVQNILGEERIGKKANPKWEKLRALAKAHPRAIIVPVHAEEATGRNKIPVQYATMIEHITGLLVGMDIVQSVRANHTGANAEDRMTRRAAFDGYVERGAEYILVDDHVTQGGTLNELRKFIQSHGGKVVAVTTLTASQFSDTLSIVRDTALALYTKFGNNLDEELQTAGIANGVAELTQSQARELLKLRADTLRDRLAQARLARQRELGAQAVRFSVSSNRLSGYTDWLPGLKAYLKPDGTFTETGTRWAKAKQFQRAIGRELNSLIDECLGASADMPSEQTAAELERLISAVEATDEIVNGVLPNFRSDSSADDPSVMTVGPDGKKTLTPERDAIHNHIYDVLMADRITGENNEALETEKDGSAKEEAIIVRANEARPDLPPISLQNPSYETAKEFRIDIIVGPPAAGKSSVFANALSVYYRARVLDCDAVKKMLPGFNDGNGANYVHAESSMLNKRMIFDIQHRAEGDPRRGENVVLPILGNDVEGLRKKVADWHAAGYTVHLHNNRVPILHAFGRAIVRTLASGRWINPVVIRACQDNPTRAYNEVKKEVDYYDQFSNDVQFGERPIWEDGNYIDPAYGRNIKRVDEQGAQHAHDGKGVDGRLERDGGGLRSVSRNRQYILPGFERFSTETPRSGLVYPQLRSMSDDELVTAAVAVRMALGKSDKLSDRSVKINTVNKLIRRLHPEYKSADVGRESLRVMSGARKFAKRIREDLDRGVSDSLILEHLPQTAREQFGREMVEEARKGQRLGSFGQKVASAIEERQARVVEDAVRVQTGIDASIIENVFGIDLSATLMHLAENPLSQDDGKGMSGTGAGEDKNAAPAEEKDVEAKVVEAVSAVVDTARQRADENAEIRRERKANAEQKKNDGETGDESGDALPGDAEDAVAVAVKKAGLDLENPRHLAEFVAELTRRYWIKEHELAINADVWRDLVAVQFLRKTAQSIYAKLCKDLVYSRSRETAMQRIAKFDAVPTVAGLLSEMEFVGALINAQRIRDTQKAMCEKLDFFLRQKFGAQGRFKPDKEEGKRNVSAEAELRARYMRHAMWLTPDAAAEEARQLQETLDALSVDFKDAGRDRDQSREFVETIRKLNVLREFGALRYKPVGEIEAAAQWWEDFARGESDDIVREMFDRDIRTKKAAHLLAVAFADPKRTTIREGGKADALNRFITGHMGFISLLQDCMRHASDADAAAVKDIVNCISREIQKSGDRSEAEKRRHNDAFHSAVEGIYGKGFNAVMKDMMAPDERFTKFMGVVGGKRVTPTKGRALQLLVSLLQEGRKVQVEDEENPGQTKTVWEGGYHDNIVKNHREGQAAEIMRLLDPADMNMLKWLGQWYENNRADLSGVCHSLFGIGVYAELPNYFPVKMQLETQGLEKGQGVGWTIFPKALTPRVRNERDFDTSADIFSMWASRMEEAAQWKHHAQLGLEMRGIFGRAELREAVRANHGASVDELMQGFITDILAGHGAYDRSTAGVQYFSDQIRGWTALCALGGNVGVMVKQPTSIPAFGFEIGLVNTAKYMVNAFTSEGMAAMRRIWDSEQRRTRWQVGSSEAVRNALNQQGAGALKRMFQASMITNKLGDVVPALVVGQGIYRDCLARGMSEDDAMAETWSIVERTQQSGRMENQTSIQRRNKLGRIMFQFLSTQQQYLQYEVRAIREVIARPDSVKRWGSLGRAILLNHFILSSAYYWMGQLYKYALGQEPPEDELKDWIVTCLLGPYGSLFVAGFCCKYTLERAIKGYSIKGGSSMLPMESWLKNQVNDGAKLLEAIFDSDGDTWDNMLEAAGRWMSDSNSVVRDLRKIYRYRVKDEPQK